MADNGLRPKGLLNESIKALDSRSVLNNAQIMDISDDLNVSANRSNDKDGALMTLLANIWTKKTRIYPT